MSKVDLLFLAFNRLEYTKESFHWLVENTNWNLVRNVTVWDDGSSDGTKEWLEKNLDRIPADCELKHNNIGSPVDVMARWIETCRASLIAKIDNDAVMPPAWLDEAVAVLDSAPELDFLGLEALCAVSPKHDGPRGYRPAETISGLGLYRRRCFSKSLPTSNQRWFGFENWQLAQGEELSVGWIDPGLPVILLDRLPMDMWRKLADAYAVRGWHRRWECYNDASASLWSWRWDDGNAAPVTAPSRDALYAERPFDVVVLSANPENARRCVTAVLANEPSLNPSQIIVVDDGAGKDKSGPMANVRWVKGKKPFNFARNANIGIAASQRDVILLNDDALLETEAGFTSLSARNDGQHIVSAAVKGVVGNPNQRPGRRGLRYEHLVLCFVCVHIPRDVLNAVGPLDETFVGYGFEDNDYCDRARDAGYHLAILDDCVVAHGDDSRSSFRSAPDFLTLFEQNKSIYEKKRAATCKNTFLGVMRIKNEAAHIGEVIESVLPLCESIVILDDHSEDNTVEICESYGDRISIIPSPFEGLDESRDKNFLLGEIRERSPNWVIWIDGDEVLAPGSAELIRRCADDPRGYGTMTFDVCYVWDHSDQIRIDGIFGRMRRASAFRYRAASAARLRFQETHGVNLHCGNVPLGVTGPDAQPGVRLKHYGYVTAEQRKRKYEWYTSIDPNNPAEDNYRHLKGDPRARYAPGEPVFAKWHE